MLSSARRRYAECGAPPTVRGAPWQSEQPHAEAAWQSQPARRPHAACRFWHRHRRAAWAQPPPRRASSSSRDVTPRRCARRCSRRRAQPSSVRSASVVKLCDACGHRPAYLYAARHCEGWREASAGRVVMPARRAGEGWAASARRRSLIAASSCACTLRVLLVSRALAKRGMDEAQVRSRGGGADLFAGRQRRDFVLSLRIRYSLFSCVF